jgi:eukaryotic-like serine/threonine-protein kinase
MSNSDDSPPISHTPAPTPTGSAAESIGSTELEPGTRIGSYALESKLARGGFGDIWIAAHEDTGQRVAIKVLHAELVVSEAIVMRFEQEARAVAMARHLNVVELYDFGKLPDHRPYMVMELLSGRDLEAQVKSSGAMAPRRVLDVLEPLCSALTAAHERGIVHRDLKASNVVLSEREGVERVVLLDFGIAKLLEAGGPQLTASRVTIGSPVCMAPEQIQGKPVDPRTDVYALGSLTFFMLTGELPFPGRSVDAMHQHLVAPRPRPSDRMDVSPSFDPVVVKAMAKEPDDRYSGVGAFMDAFRAALEADETAPPRRSDPAPRPSPPGTPVPCVGLYIDVRVDEDELEDPEEDLLDDMDAIFPRAHRFLEEQGYLLAYESGDSALFVLPLPAQEEERKRARERAVEQAGELLDELASRDGRDPRVGVGIHLHVDQATIVRGLVTEGPLLDVSAWANSAERQGIAATSAMVEDLELSPPGE